MYVYDLTYLSSSVQLVFVNTYHIVKLPILGLFDYIRN